MRNLFLIFQVQRRRSAMAFVIASIVALGAPNTWAQSSASRVEAVGGALSKLVGIMEKNAEAKHQAELRRAEQEARYAQEQAQKQRQAGLAEQAILERTRNDPSLDPFGSATQARATAARQSTPQASSSALSGVMARTAQSTAASSGRLACTDEVMLPRFNAISARQPKTSGVCDSARASQKVFGEMLQLIEHCPDDSGPWRGIRQELNGHLQVGKDMERSACG